jgi:hypothetical protein
MQDQSISNEERAKLEQISEEILKGMRQVADILGSKMNQQTNLPITKFTIYPPPPGKKLNMVEITFQKDSTGTPGLCYQDPPGICCGHVCPCVPIET